MIINLDGVQSNLMQESTASSFRFEAWWLHEEGCAEMITNAWQEAFGAGAATVSEGVDDVARVLTDWNRNVLGDLVKRIKKVKKELAACLKSAISDSQVHREQVLRYRLSKLEEQKDMYRK